MGPFSAETFVMACRNRLVYQSYRTQLKREVENLSLDGSFYHPSRCKTASSGLRKAGLNVPPVGYATGIKATCVTDR
jgi:hypothetical protein